MFSSSVLTSAGFHQNSVVVERRGINVKPFFLLPPPPGHCQSLVAKVTLLLQITMPVFGNYVQNLIVSNSIL